MSVHVGVIDVCNREQLSTVLTWLIDGNMLMPANLPLYNPI
jgi:hypothetical protein